MPIVPFTGTCSRGAEFEIDDAGVVSSCRFAVLCADLEAELARRAAPAIVAP